MHSSVSSLRRQLAVQRRVLWALVMRETITMYGREGLGVLWIIAEPTMFIVGVMVIFSFRDSALISGISPAEYLAVSYPTLLFWRNGTGKVIIAINVNRALLHHRLIRPIDIVYARIILVFSSGVASFFVLYPIFTFIGITHLPYNLFEMVVGYLLVIWFSFAFVVIMSALSELSDSIEKASHILLYLMLPFSGAFFPLYILPEEYRIWMMKLPLINAVECFHAGYFGSRMPTYYNLGYTVITLLAMTLFSYGLTELAIKRVKVG